MKINKIILLTSLETILLIMLLFVTSMIWNDLDIDSAAKIAYISENNKHLNLDVENNLSSLNSLEDNIALNDNNLIKINIKNDSNVKKHFNLYLKISDDTNLFTNYLKFAINNEINYLNKMYYYKLDNNIYFLIKTDEIDSKEDIVYIMHLWLSSITPRTEQIKKLNIEYFLEEV